MDWKRLLRYVDTQDKKQENILSFLLALDDGGKKKGGRCMNTSGATTSFADSRCQMNTENQITNGGCYWQLFCATLLFNIVGVVIHLQYIYDGESPSSMYCKCIILDGLDGMGSLCGTIL